MSIYRDLMETEIQWVPYRLRLAPRDDDSFLDPRTTPYKLDLGENYFCINGMKLMEKPGTTATHRHSHQDTAWGDKAGGSGGGGQHTQYIRRLADLRDELINQEETALARALDRLRLHSINNRDAARYRLKLKEPATESPRAGMSVSQGTSFPRPMVTTVEKFRQMRPQRRPPVIFPLQGKQLIETSPTSSGRVTQNSTEEGSRGVEDTVKANLQRLIQPTSSIPNIGRKALRQESLELRSQSLQNMRNRVFKSTRPHLASSFMLQPHGLPSDDEGDSRADSEGELHMSPHAYKLGPMMDGDRLNMDKLNQYYYICCLPQTPASREGDQERPSINLATPYQGQRRGLRMGGGGGGGQKPRRTNSERSHITRPFSDRSSVMVSSDTEVETTGGSVNPRYRHSLDTLADGGGGAGGVGGVSERVSLPVICSDGESPAPVSRRLQPRRNVHDRTAFPSPHRERSLSPDTLASTERRRRHIVVDMPHIIFNAATPDIPKEPALAEGGTFTERPGTLSKTLKQNEIRHRELQNLLEDVKELNKRTETLSTHAQGTELDASAAGVC